MLTSYKRTGSPSAILTSYLSPDTGFLAFAGLSSSPRVHGALSVRLGCTAGRAIDGTDFLRLLSARDAAGGELLGGRGPKRKVAAIDLTFSAPKSVSIAALLTTQDPKIIAAHEKAVLNTAAQIESAFAGAHPEPCEHVKTGKLVYVTITNGVNANREPHLHTHVVVMNLTEYEGRIRSLDCGQILRPGFNHQGGAVYRAVLAAKLRQLGYSVDYTKQGFPRLSDVPPEIEEAFSTRRAEVGARKSAGDADMMAWRVSRPTGQTQLSAAELLAAWRRLLVEVKGA